jgi:hypothetical protein
MKTFDHVATNAMKLSATLLVERDVWCCPTSLDHLLSGLIGRGAPAWSMIASASRS